MNIEEARKRYKYDLGEGILSGYKDYDKTFAVNEGDRRLLPIRLSVEGVIKATYKKYYTEYPGIPDWECVDNFGLPASEQIYFRHEIPQRLVDLEQKVIRDLEDDSVRNKTEKVTAQKILAETNRRLNYDKKFYKDEIEYIQRMWYYRLFGRWIFINGKLTYIDGWHDSYCSWHHMGDVGYPHYRDADRKSMLFYKYAYTTTHTFKHLDKSGYAIPNDKGLYEMIDTGHRTCYGIVVPKKRREGATNQILHIGSEIVTTMAGSDVLFGIQGDGEATSKSHYQTKFLPSFKKKPFFFKPMWSGANTPLSGIKFNLPASMAHGEELESQINYATTAHGSFYDHTKLYAYLGDEWGKVQHIDILDEIYGRVKPTMAQGAGSIIIGFCGIPSTVEDMDGFNADKYFELCESSNFFNRLKASGQTKSGLFLKFIKAEEGLEGFIDKYGQSVTTNPTKEQQEFIGRKYGSRDYIMDTREGLAEANTYIAKKALRSFKKRFPQEYDECFTGSSGDIGWDIDIIDEAIKRVRIDDKLYVRGNFEWQGGVKDSKVVFIRDPEGIWEVDSLFIDAHTNKRITSQIFDVLLNKSVNSYMPAPDVITRCTIGIDPFEFSFKSEVSLRKDKDKMSDGGITVMLNRNKEVDTDDKDVYEWETYKFIAVTRHRTPIEADFVDEGIKAAVYFGGMIYSERNKTQVTRICRERGYLGYLKYDVDEFGKVAEQPGYYAGNVTKKETFNLFRDYLEMRGHVTNLPLLLNEAKEIKRMEELTGYDALASAMAALKGTTSVYDELKRREMDVIHEYSPDDYVEKYFY